MKEGVIVVIDGNPFCRYSESVTYHKKSLAIKREVGYVLAYRSEKFSRGPNSLCCLFEFDWFQILLKIYKFSQ